MKIMITIALLASSLVLAQAKEQPAAQSSVPTVTGTNTGDVTIGTANGLSISGQALSLGVADGSNAGAASTGAQTFAGAKTFTSSVIGTAASNFCFDASCLWKIVKNSNDLDLVTSGNNPIKFLNSSGSVTLPYGLVAGGNAGSVRLTVQTSGMSIGPNGSLITDNPRGTGTLDFASALIGACSADLTITVSSCSATADVSLSVPNASVAAGSQFFAWVSTAGTVSVRHCCQAGTSCDPASGSFAARCWNP